MITGVKKEQQEEIIDKVVKNCPKEYDPTERILLIDSDSIMYYSTYFPEDSLMEFPTEEEQIEEAKFRVGNKVQEITNNVEEWFNITRVLLFVGGTSNFRYRIYSEYKANRKNAIKSPYLPIVKKYLVEDLGAIESHGAEADDWLYDAWKLSEGNAIVATIDKDLKSSCHGIFYDYRPHDDTLGKFYTVTEEESRLNLAMQLITGDTSDGVNLCPKKGQKYAEKVLSLGMTNYQFNKVLLNTYIDAWNKDVKVAKDKLRLCYKLLKLHTLEEIKQYI